MLLMGKQPACEASPWNLTCHLTDARRGLLLPAVCLWLCQRRTCCTGTVVHSSAAVPHVACHRSVAVQLQCGMVDALSAAAVWLPPGQPQTTSQLFAAAQSACLTMITCQPAHARMCIADCRLRLLLQGKAIPPTGPLRPLPCTRTPQTIHTSADAPDSAWNAVRASLPLLLGPTTQLAWSMTACQWLDTPRRLPQPPVRVW